MKGGFLRSVAELHSEKFGSSVSDFCFIFPNRRSSLFFANYLGKSSNRAIFSPKLLTIDELFNSLSGLKMVSKVEALYLLFKEFERLSNSEESFDDFISWGDMLINDFDDLDKYLADPKQLFSNITDLHQIDDSYSYLTENQIDAIKEFWSNFLPDEEKSQSKGKFRATWEILYPLYISFNKVLRDKGLGYQGMIYRDVIDKINEDSSIIKIAFPDIKRFVFVGLNALNNCEITLLKQLQSEKESFETDFYWDYYGEKIKDPINKSSLFMSKNVVDFPSQFQIKEYDIPEQNYSLYAVQSNTSQAKVVTKILEKIYSEDNDNYNFDNCAIILPDENLLLPLMNSIPKYIEKINVTMGSSIKNSSIYSLITSFAQLHSNSKANDTEYSFYWKDVIDIIDFPLFRKWVDFTQLKIRIVKDNIVYPNISLLNSYDDTNSGVFVKLDTWRDAANYLLTIIDKLQIISASIEKEYLFYSYKTINQLQNLDIEMNVKTFFRLVKSLISSLSISFNGEPLCGLQIMGPLETRALDFDTLIILSMNEGKFPKKSLSSSYIPYNIRKGFSLPNYEFQDSISAYHFYRSIYRAKDIHFIYDNSVGGDRSGEVSRFVRQLETTYSEKINNYQVNFNLSLNNNPDYEVVKSKDILETLRHFPYSASSLNYYMDCPMKFYYSYIKGIHKEKSVTEDLEVTTLGNLFHRTLQALYTPYIGNIITADIIDSIIKNTTFINQAIEQSFKEENISKVSGKNLILKRIIGDYVYGTLKYDRYNAPFQFVGAEMKFHSKLDLGKDITINLKGFIDRLDIKDDVLRLIDYKTGRVDSVKFDIDDLFKRDKTYSPSIHFQLALYIYLVKNSDKFIDKHSQYQLESVVFSVRSLFSNPIPFRFTLVDDDYSQFESNLRKLFAEIISPEVNFTMTQNVNICKYCDYKRLCNR